VEALDRSDHLYPAAYFTGGGAGYPDYVADELVHRRQARAYLRRAERYGVRAGPDRRVFDIGCAAGFFLAEAAKQGWQVAGCDVSDYAVAHARECLGIAVEHAGFLDTDVAPGTVDLITMFNVFEHLPHPRLVAFRAHELLSPGGMLMIETWNRRSLIARVLGSRWPGYAPPTVLYYHSPRSLRDVFGPDRWDLVHYGWGIKWISVRHGQAVLEHARSLAARPLGAAIQAVPALGTVCCPYATGDLVLAVFRRKEPGPRRVVPAPARAQRARGQAPGVRRSAGVPG
jgi:SAM-dependent methyltransferase